MNASMTATRVDATPEIRFQHEPIRLPQWVYGLSSALAAISFFGGIAILASDGILRGPAVMNGSARGTALVMFAVGVPAIVAAMVMAARGSARAVFVWIGAGMYLAYNAFMQLLGTPLNSLFLVYVAALALAGATTTAVIATAGPRTLARRCRPTLPARGLAVYLLVIVVMNAIAWLGRIVPALIANEPESLLEGTGITMMPTYLQDLAFWLPLLAVGAVWLWRRLPWGYVIAGGGLAMWSLEGLAAFLRHVDPRPAPR